MLSVFLFALRLPLGLSSSLYSLGAVYFVFLFSFVCILQLLVLHNTQKALSYCSLDAKVDGLFVLYSIQYSSTHFYCSSFETGLHHSNWISSLWLASSVKQNQPIVISQQQQQSTKTTSQVAGIKTTTTRLQQKNRHFAPIFLLYITFLHGCKTAKTVTFLLLLLLIALISLLIQILTSKTVVLYLGWIVGTLLLQLKELITLSLKYMLRNIAVVFRKLMLIVEKRKRAKSFALLARGVGLILCAYQFDNCVFVAKRKCWTVVYFEALGSAQASGSGSLWTQVVRRLGGRASRPNGGRASRPNREQASQPNGGTGSEVPEKAAHR